MNNNEQKHLGKLIFEIEGQPQKKGWFKKTKSHLAFYEKGIVIEELGDYIEILKKNIAKELSINKYDIFLYHSE